MGVEFPRTRVLDHPCGLIGAGHFSRAFALAVKSTLHPEVMRELKNRFDCRGSGRNHGGRGMHSGIPGGSIRWSSEFEYHRSASDARQR
jgi:hypothetical protein